MQRREGAAPDRILNVDTLAPAEVRLVVLQPLVPREAWISGGRPVLHFRPSLRER